MKLVEINWNPSARQLRQFGVICLFALPIIGWMWNATPTTLGMLFAVGLVIAATSLLVPTAVKTVFLALCVVALPIGMIVGELAILSIFFGVFLPLGLLFQLARRDALHLNFDRNADTYWQSKTKPSGARSYYRQS